MRIAAPVLAVAVIACASPSSPAPRGAARGSLTYRLVKSGAYGNLANDPSLLAQPEASLVVASGEAGYRSAWTTNVGEGDPPPVDFPHERAVFLLLGARRTGGYSIDVRSVSIDGGTLVVEAPVTSPRAGGITSQALTAPWAVIAVKGPVFRDVRWVDAEKKEVAVSTR